MTIKPASPYRASLYIAFVLLALTLSGCAGWWNAHRADSLIKEGEVTAGIKIYESLARDRPQKYLAKYVRVRDREVRRLLAEAEVARSTQDSARALEAYRATLELDSRQAEALYGLDLLVKDDRNVRSLATARNALASGNAETALAILSGILAEDPDNREANALRRQIQVEDIRNLVVVPILKDSMRKTVSLEFRDASVSAILEILAQTAGINFILDRDVRADMRTTIFARQTTVEDALRLVLQTSQLGMKALNENTVLVFPDNSDKQRRYEDLVTRSFYLGSAEPARALELVRAMAAPKAAWVDERLRLMVVRDRLEVVDTIERLVAAYDIPSPEVLLEVQVLEISRDALLNLGLQAPDTVSTNVYGAANKAGVLSVDEARNLNSDNFKVFLPDPLAVLSLQQTSGNSNTLATPRLRVKSLEKASIMIGDKVPVITTTTNDVSTSESVSYLDVGLKLQAKPEVHANNDVSISLDLEVSNIVKEIKSSSGLLTYQIGTRNASTSLRVRDGETQILAGLIRNDDRESASHVPGIGKLPMLGRLFSNTNNTRSKSEIVLLITPHVVRSLHKPSADVVEFPSGTEERVSTRPLRLTPAASYSQQRMSLTPAEAAQTAIQVTTDNAAGIMNPPPPFRPSDNTTGSSRLDPTLAQIRLEMIAPIQVHVGQEFTLALMATGRPADTLAFDIDIDPDKLTLVRAVPVGLQGKFAVEPRANGYHVSARGVSGTGLIAMLTLKPSAAQDKPLVVQMANADARRDGDIALLVSAAPPRELQILP